jgi:hypothetical protein
VARDLRGQSYIGPMIRLQITPLAFDAICATLPASVGYENKRAANGDWFIWLDHATVAKLGRLRAPGESYSDVILALAEDAGAER